MDSLAKSEREAIAALEAELAEHSNLALLAFDTAGAALQSVLQEGKLSDLASSRLATSLLLIRLSNDIRCAVLLTNRGYTLQAATIVAAMYEEAWTLAAIGSDDSLAQQWCEHDDPKSPFMKAVDLTRTGLKKCDPPDEASLQEQLKTEYRVYRQLCWMKHANPLLQREHGYVVDPTDEAVVFQNGPDCSEKSARVAWFVLEHAAGLMYIALASYWEHHVPSELQQNIAGAVARIGDWRKKLEERAKARWGTDDPFPGKW